MLYYESGYTPEALVEKVNKHKGEVTIHSIQTITVLNDIGLPELAFVAFFSVKPVGETLYKGEPVPLGKRRFIGVTPPPEEV